MIIIMFIYFKFLHSEKHHVASIIVKIVAVIYIYIHIIYIVYIFMLKLKFYLF